MLQLEKPCSNSITQYILKHTYHSFKYEENK